MYILENRDKYTSIIHKCNYKLSTFIVYNINLNWKFVSVADVKSDD